VKATGDNHLAQATISTAGRDREGDEIVSSGVDVQPFLRNPVVLWAHDYKSLPVGRATAVNKGRDSLTASWQWADGDAFAERVKHCWQQGILNAVSVGIRPKEVERLSDGTGVKILTSELLEFSVVPVPANAEALRRMKAAGLLSSSSFAARDGVLELSDSDDEVVLDVSQHAFQHAVAEGVTAAYAEVISDELRRSLNYAMGRIDDGGRR
jgi:HK97 family phage prohead protease